MCYYAIGKGEGCTIHFYTWNLFSIILYGNRIWSDNATLSIYDMGATLFLRICYLNPYLALSQKEKEIQGTSVKSPLSPNDIFFEYKGFLKKLGKPIEYLGRIRSPCGYPPSIPCITIHLLWTFLSLNQSEYNWFTLKFAMKSNDAEKLLTELCPPHTALSLFYSF